LIKFNYFTDVFIGVAFPTRFLGFAVGELDYGSKIYGYCFFCSLDMDSFCSLRAQNSINFRVSNLPYHENWDFDLDYLKSLDMASRNVLYPHSVYDKLGRICFGFDPFGVYVAINLRKITGNPSRSKIISLPLLSLYQLENLKDPPNSNNYPIFYKYDVVESSYMIFEGLHDSPDFGGISASWVSQAFIEIGFRNPKDIMIHPTLNQFKYWSDVFLSRLGFSIYRCV
jgi:hypothetical protein